MCPRRIRSRLLLLAPLVVSATACGEDGDSGVSTGTVAAFCEDWQQGKAALSDFDPESGADFETLRDTVAEITYPEGLADEADTLVAGLDELVEQLDGAEPGAAQLEEVLMGAQSELSEAFDAADQLQTFGEEEC